MRPAVEELEKAGDVRGPHPARRGQDDIDRQLSELTSGAQVDDELAKMKAELGAGGGDAPALEQGEGEGVIVRISGEGQFRLPDEDADRLNELDNRAVPRSSRATRPASGSSGGRCSSSWRATATRSTTRS